MAVQWLTPGDQPPRTPSSAAVAAMPVPRIDQPLTFDGKPEDWGVHGLRVDYLGQPDGDWPAPDDTAAALKLGWTPRGLAVLVTVTDDKLIPANTVKRQRRGDRVSLRLSDGDAVLDVDVSLAQAGEPPVVRVRKQSKKVPTVEPAAAVTPTDTGYVTEVLLPWGALPGFTPKSAARCGFNMARRVDAVRARVELRTDLATGAHRLEIGGEPRLIGETVVIKSGEVTVGKVRLERVSGFAGAEFALPQPWRGPVTDQRLDALTVELDDRTLAYANLDPAHWANPPEPGVASAVKRQTAPPEFPDAEVVAFGHSGWFVHRLRFTGLTPGTDYAIAVPGRLAPVRFRTAPATLERRGHHPPRGHAARRGGEVGPAVWSGWRRLRLRQRRGPRNLVRLPEALERPHDPRRRPQRAHARGDWQPRNRWGRPNG